MRGFAVGRNRAVVEQILGVGCFGAHATPSNLHRFFQFALSKIPVRQASMTLKTVRSQSFRLGVRFECGPWMQNLQTIPSVRLVACDPFLRWLFERWIGNGYEQVEQARIPSVFNSRLPSQHHLREE